MAEVMYCDLCGKEVKGVFYGLCLYQENIDKATLQLDVCSKCKLKVTNAITKLRTIR